jgi:hypothetical protein
MTRYGYFPPCEETARGSSSGRLAGCFELCAGQVPPRLREA